MNYFTAGESHGPQLTGILQGIPAGLKINVNKINQLLAARQKGYGRSHRQKIENDKVQILGGLRHHITLGSPLALVIKNQDNIHWKGIMDPLGPKSQEDDQRKLSQPRPGHADLVGGMKYGHRDLRNVLERSSARETAMKVAVGGICKQLLAKLGITLVGYVSQVGKVIADEKKLLDVSKIQQEITQNDLRIIDQKKVLLIHHLIDETKQKGTTVGGILRIIVNHVPAGLGSYISWDNKLDAKIASAVLGVNAIKGIEFGDGFNGAGKLGYKMMDTISWNKDQGFIRDSDHLGGFEGGMTNGMPIIIKAVMKPIPTQKHPLKTVNIDSKELKQASRQRSDTTAIVPASVVLESVVAIEVAKAITDMFDANSLTRLKKQFLDYRKEIRNY